MLEHLDKYRRANKKKARAEGPEYQVVTVRVPKDRHPNCLTLAAAQDVSLNSLFMAGLDAIEDAIKAAQPKPDTATLEGART